MLVKKTNSEKKMSNIKVNKEERSSYFVIDLKKTFDKDKAKAEKKIVGFKEYMEKLAGFNVKKSILRQVQDKNKKATQAVKEAGEAGKESIYTDVGDLYVNHENSANVEFKKKNILNNFKRLAFIRIFCLFFSGLKKIGGMFIYFGKGVSHKCRFLKTPLLKPINLLNLRFKRSTETIKIFIITILKTLLGLFSLKSLNDSLAVFKSKKISVVVEKKETITASTEEVKPRDVSKAEIYENDLLNSFPRTKWGLLKPVVIFSLLVFAMAVPLKLFSFIKSLDIGELKGRVLGVSESALGDLKNATDSAVSLNFSEASLNFSKAGENFMEAQDQLSSINDIFFKLAKIIPQDEMRLASESKKILAAGQTASEIGVNLSLAFDGLFSEENGLKRLEGFNLYANKALAGIESLNNQLADINQAVLPEEYRSQFGLMKTTVAGLEKGLVDFNQIIDGLSEFLGANQDKRYLLVFQNNTEARATGGFIGSFAIIDFRDGKIKNLEVPTGGSYDTEGGMTEFISSPAPLHLVNSNWYFWDANWWPDWPTSARKLMWFYERSGGSTVDGVISFTPTVMENLLGVIGPIDMTEEYGVVVDKENFWLTVQSIAEQKLSPDEKALGVKHEPKKIIGDLLNKIIEKLLADVSQETFSQFLKVAQTSLDGKHILFYFADEKLQASVKNYGWDGSLKETNWDYLSVINSNIAGGKSDKRIKEEIDQVAQVFDDGSIINTVKIKRTHTGEKNEPFAGVRNVNWLRVYVPEGSELLEARGYEAPEKIYFDEENPNAKDDPDVFREETLASVHEPSGTKIYSENGKTVFANWSMVDPGESTEIYLRYRLPFKLEKQVRPKDLMDKAREYIDMEMKDLYPYAILVQKQAGSADSQITSSLILPDSFKINWKYPNNLNTLNDGWHMSERMNNDKYWAALLEK